jgi:hypothetical protein
VVIVVVVVTMMIVVTGEKMFVLTMVAVGDAVTCLPSPYLTLSSFHLSLLLILLLHRHKRQHPHFPFVLHLSCKAGRRSRRRPKVSQRLFIQYLPHLATRPLHACIIGIGVTGYAGAGVRLFSPPWLLLRSIRERFFDRSRLGLGLGLSLSVGCEGDRRADTVG